MRKNAWFIALIMVFVMLAVVVGPVPGNTAIPPCLSPGFAYADDISTGDVVSLKVIRVPIWKPGTTEQFGTVVMEYPASLGVDSSANFTISLPSGFSIEEHYMTDLNACFDSIDSSHSDNTISAHLNSFLLTDYPGRIEINITAYIPDDYEGDIIATFSGDISGTVVMGRAATPPDDPIIEPPRSSGGGGGGRTSPAPEPEPEPVPEPEPEIETEPLPPKQLTTTFSLDSTTYTKVLDGYFETLEMDIQPYIKNDRTYVPVRYLAYALGVPEDGITWDNDAKEVRISTDEVTIILTIDSTLMSVNGEPVTMDVAPEITNGRTTLPARWVAEALGAEVEWDAAQQQAIIKMLVAEPEE